MGANVEYKRLRPSQVLLDPQNPRLPDGTSNDKEAINRLLAEGYTQLIALARDLTDRGEANPTELPIVIKDVTKYVVLEGNRRFAGLKVLANPRLADDPGHQAAFERLKKRGKQPPKTIFCAVASDRDEADHWITLRHTGANEGVGVRVWSPEQNARHRKRMKAPIDSGTLRSIAIADELTEAYQADDELVSLIKKVRSEKLTNIGRLFSGVTLTRMQFVLKGTDDDSQTLWAKHTAAQLRDYFLWAFRFLDDKSVDAFKNDPLRGSLLNEHAEILPDPADSMSEHQRLADHPYSPTTEEAGDAASSEDGDPDGASSDTGNGAGQASSDSASDGQTGESSGDENDPGGDSSSGNAGRKRDQKAERSLYSTVKLSNLSPSIQRLLKEAKQLSIDDNYATACVLARVILELAVSDPKVLTWSGKKENDKLADKIRGCIYKLDPLIDSLKRTRQDLVQAHLDTKEIGVTYLHQFMHNPAAKSDPHLARRFSAEYSPLLNGINGAVK
jgi:hypothetical protein